MQGCTGQSDGWEKPALGPGNPALLRVLMTLDEGEECGVPGGSQVVQESDANGGRKAMGGSDPEPFQGLSRLNMVRTAAAPSMIKPHAKGIPIDATPDMKANSAFPIADPTTMPAMARANRATPVRPIVFKRKKMPRMAPMPNSPAQMRNLESIVN